MAFFGLNNLEQVWKNKSLILEGIRNTVYPPENLKELIAETVKFRQNICNSCPHMSLNAKINNGYESQRFDDHCTLCGCNIQLKSASLNSSCPDDPKRWNAVVSDQEFSDIKQVIKNHEESTSKEHKNSTTSGDNKEV